MHGLVQIVTSRSLAGRLVKAGSTAPFLLLRLPRRRSCQSWFDSFRISDQPVAPQPTVSTRARTLACKVAEWASLRVTSAEVVFDPVSA
jgi:hypothetical protein